MEISLTFKQVGYVGPSEFLIVHMEGPPREVNDLVEAIREKSKEWKNWEER